MRLSDIIKEYRKTHNMTTEELARRCGLSKGYISMLENSFKPTGRKKDIVPSIIAIKKLSVGMGIDFDFLLSSVEGDVSLVSDKIPRRNYDKSKEYSIDHVIPYAMLSGLGLDKKIINSALNIQLITNDENIKKGASPDYSVITDRIMKDRYLLSTILKAAYLNSENRDKLTEYIDMLITVQDSHEN